MSVLQKNPLSKEQGRANSFNNFNEFLTLQKRSIPDTMREMVHIGLNHLADVHFNQWL